MKTHSALLTILWHHALYMAIFLYLLGVLVLLFQRGGVSFLHILKWPKFFFDIERYEKFMLKGSPTSWQQAYEAKKEVEKMWDKEYGPILIDKNPAGHYYLLVKVLGQPTAGLLAAAKQMPTRSSKGVEIVLQPSQF